MSPSQPVKRIIEVPAGSAISQPPPRLSVFERLLVQHAHPVKLVFDIIAYMWGLYLFSRHELVGGLVVLFGVGGLGTLLTLRFDEVVALRTPIGKFFYATAHPLSYSFQFVGYVVVACGTWYHSTPLILAGVTAILLGHAFGWDRLRRLSPG